MFFFIKLQLLHVRLYVFVQSLLSILRILEVYVENADPVFIDLNGVLIFQLYLKIRRVII